jgi:hypothetical protein
MLLSMKDLICETLPFLRVVESAILIEDSNFLRWSHDRAIAAENHEKIQYQNGNRNGNENYGTQCNGNQNFFFPTQPLKLTPRPSASVLQRIKALQDTARNSSFSSSISTSFSGANSNVNVDANSDENNEILFLDDIGDFVD